MSFKTRLLKLFKYDTEIDKKQTFKIDEALNRNWDVIEENFLASKYNENTTYNKSDNDWVWDIINNEKIIFKSKKDNNIGHEVTDKNWWEKVNFNSGGGLEVCDIGLSLYVDESKGLRRYLNGQIVAINANTQGFLTKLKSIVALHPSLLATEEEWQNAKTYSAYGQVGKFVFNYAEDNETVLSVRLPAIVNIQGLFDLQNLGLTIPAGLPNIYGTVNFMGVYGSDFLLRNASGALKAGNEFATGNHSQLGIQAGSYEQNLTVNASESNPLYGNSNTVQQEAVQYPYFIQIATGTSEEVNIINEYELNNPFFFGMSFYSPIEPKNISSLKSVGQWNLKAIYPAYYNWILENINNEIEGFKNSTDENITDYDFVINQSDETFRLPLLNGSETLISNNYQTLPINQDSHVAPCNGLVTCMANNDTAINGYYGFHLYNETKNYRSGASCNGQYTASGAQIIVERGDNFNLYYQSSITPSNYRFYPFAGNGSLYFYVGETVQNPNLINAGVILESLPTKTNAKQAAHAASPSNISANIAWNPVTTSDNRKRQKYQLPADGYIEANGVSTAQNQYLRLRLFGEDIDVQNLNEDKILLAVNNPVTGSSSGVYGYIEGAKGQYVVIDTSTSITLTHLKFVYKNGSL